jgi:hypothetical protein
MSVPDSRPLFLWRPVARAVSYRIQIDTIKSFTSPAMTALDVSDTAFKPLSDLKNRKYYWRVSCSLNPSQFSWTDSLIVVPPVGVEGGVMAAQGRELTATPNPFNLSTIITYCIPEHRNGLLSIYSSNGALILTQAIHGTGTFHWDAGKRASGVYMCRLAIGKTVYVKKMMLMR